MANNRMYLVHRPSGIGVCICKRMAWYWYSPVNERSMEEFFAAIADVSRSDAEQDDVMVVMEDCSAKSRFVETEWGKMTRYGVNLVRFSAPWVQHNAEDAVGNGQP